MAASSKSNQDVPDIPAGDDQTNGSNEADGASGQDAALTASFSSMDVSDGRGESYEHLMAEEKELRRTATENYADGGVSGSFFRRRDLNPYTNEVMFSLAVEKKG
ncbi:hypothetical protein A9K55_005020 [Cordyceps militaris]|uniref:Uncharacterized protein n=1 Tax=Cordyceps militaris TaxID=73501 RepID=A0A2H4SLS2_CORMI|nr:hypothetical protein A9K55_005020 [Cordyceps militaris]